MPFVECFCMLEPRDFLVNCSGWYDTLLFTLYIIWKWQSVASPYVARFTYLSVCLPLPWRSWIPTFWIMLTLERTYINSTYILWHLDKIITSPGVCRFALTSLSSSVATANVTSYHRAEWTMIWYSSGGILTLYALCMGYISQLLQLLRLPTTTETIYYATNCYIRRFLSVLWWTRYPAALCCLYARWNQSSDAQ